nr:NYN domain-containing protein [Pseudomonas corrugata]
MSFRDDVPKVAIYWDFENLHATLLNQQSGETAYRNSRSTSQPLIVNLAPILDYAASFGDIIINRAYGNWQWFEQYRHVLMAGGVDLIQMFPRGQNMKNSADIRLAIDALSDVYTHPHLSHIIIVSSDSDFISLAQRIKQAGRFVAGIGIDGSTNRFWPLACSEFKFYQNLLPKLEAATSQPPAAPVTLAAPMPPVDSAAPSEAQPNPFTEAVSAPTMEEAKDTLDRVVRQLVRRNGANFSASAGVKSLLIRALPSFDERALGFGTFSDFLGACPDIVKIVDRKSGGHIEHVGIEDKEQSK